MGGAPVKVCFRFAVVVCTIYTVATPPKSRWSAMLIKRNCRVATRRQIRWPSDGGKSPVPSTGALVCATGVASIVGNAGAVVANEGAVRTGGAISKAGGATAAGS